MGYPVLALRGELEGTEVARLREVLQVQVEDRPGLDQRQHRARGPVQDPLLGQRLQSAPRLA